MRPAPRPRLLWLAALAAAAVGCSGEHQDASPSGAAAGAIAESHTISCRQKPGVTPWASKLTIKGTATQITFEAVQPPGTQAPGDLAPSVGDNGFVIAVRDLAGGEVADGTVNLISTMPEHSHPPPPAVQAKISGGKATLANVKLFMAGLWQLKFEVVQAGKATDSPTVSLCLEG